ncbi:MAG: sugar phosphate nucleotidyltransferase, partial [Candidatus Gracilibacteria bacterium]
LPIVDKPCIQYLVEEAVKSGITEIIIITNKNKNVLKDYFSHSEYLAENLKEKNHHNLLAEIEKIIKMAKFIYVDQPKPHGDGHAILCAEKYIKNEPFAVLFGDDIYDSKVPAIKQLIQQYEKTKTPIVALHKINKKDSKKYGMIKTENQKAGLHKIKDLIEKPDPKNAPSNMAIAGKYIVTPELFKALKNANPGTNKELRLIDGMREFIKKSPIYGYEVKGTRFDTGDKLGYIKAVIHFAKKSLPEFKSGFKMP